MLSKQSVLIINMLDVGEMARNKDLNGFEMGQTVMTKRLCHISARIVVALGQQWAEEEWTL